MAELPFFPLAIDAYLADCGHLTDAEHGRYMLILMELWRAPHQRLPNDDAWLARRFRRSPEAVQSDLRPLIVEFCQCDGNWITQKRLSREFSRARKVTRQRSEAAKSRWRKEKPRSERTSGDDAARMPPAYEPTPTPTPTEEGESLTGDRGVQGGATEQRAESAPTERTPEGSRLPEGWRPEGELRQWTIDTIHGEGSGVSAGHELEKFRDHWKAQPGAKGRKADWPATWRNWIRKAIDIERGSHGNPSPKSGSRTSRPNSAVRTAANFAAALGRVGGGGSDQPDRGQDAERVETAERPPSSRKT